jgi:hypothetical protein
VLLGPGNATELLALMLRDAATYDAETKTGGFDGSILINRCVVIGHFFAACAACTSRCLLVGHIAAAEGSDTGGAPVGCPGVLKAVECSYSPLSRSTVVIVLITVRS